MSLACGFARRHLTTLYIRKHWCRSTGGVKEAEHGIEQFGNCENGVNGIDKARVKCMRPLRG